ncbi:MAG: holo-ACP synthase [Roseimicrobium sp.]
MRIIGLGLDLVEVARIHGLLEKWGPSFKERVFTSGERAYCETHSQPAIHYAARFAAKEAVAKALGTGFTQGVSWQDIEVRRDERGLPSVLLHGETLCLAESLGISGWLLSLTHTETTAAASAVAVG